VTHHKGEFVARKR